MYLFKLKIINKDNEIIRDISFKKGLNIVKGVINNTDGSSTNNLGKTTLLRSIDFCLGANYDIFYKDDEFKDVKNKIVFDFLCLQQPTFELILVDRFNNPFNKKTIKRKYIATASKKGDIKLSVINHINDTDFSDKDFSMELKKILFSNSDESPSFRQLIRKFLRREDLQISKVIKYLHQTTTNDDYESIFLFLFGFNNFSAVHEKKALKKDLKTEEANRKTFELSVNGKGLEQVILQQEIDLSSLLALRDAFKIQEKYEADEDKLGSLQNKINSLDSKISSKQSNIEILSEKMKDLLNNKLNDSSETISLIYQEAKLLDVKLHRKFEEVLDFHNSMMQHEIDYLRKRINNENDILADLKFDRVFSAQQYSELLQYLGKTGSLAEFTRLNDQINQLTKDISKNKTYTEQLTNSKFKISTIKSRLEIVNDIMQQSQSDLKVKISIFNKHFVEYCSILFEEKYFLFADPVGDTINFRVDLYQGLFGAGRKQAIVTAFDLAYMAFIHEINLPFPSFATHDRMEVIDSVILQKISDLANEANGQLIFPIVEDKFMSLDDNLADSVILSLSQENKFFLIESNTDQELIKKKTA